jgi:hypothetical protein
VAFVNPVFSDLCGYLVMALVGDTDSMPIGQTVLIVTYAYYQWYNTYCRLMVVRVAPGSYYHGTLE